MLFMIPIGVVVAGTVWGAITTGEIVVKHVGRRTKAKKAVKAFEESVEGRRMEKQVANARAKLPTNRDIFNLKVKAGLAQKKADRIKTKVYNKAYKAAA